MLGKLPQSGVVGNYRVHSPCGHLTLPIPPPFPQKSTAALSDKKHSVVPPSVFYLSLAYHFFTVIASQHPRGGSIFMQKDRFLHQSFPLEREGVSGADG